jgi:hypothetical protein
MPGRFIPIGGGGGPAPGGDGFDPTRLMKLLYPASKVAGTVGRLTDTPELGDAGTALSGISDLYNVGTGIAAGDPIRAAQGAVGTIGDVSKLLDVPYVSSVAGPLSSLIGLAGAEDPSQAVGGLASSLPGATASIGALMEGVPMDLAMGASPIGAIMGGIGLVQLLQGLAAPGDIRKDERQHYTRAMHDINIAAPQVAMAGPALQSLMSPTGLSDEDILAQTQKAQTSLANIPALKHGIPLLVNPEKATGQTTDRPQDESSNIQILKENTPLSYLGTLRGLDELATRGLHEPMYGGVAGDVPPTGADVFGALAPLAGVPEEKIHELFETGRHINYWTPDPSMPENVQSGWAEDIPIPGYEPGHLLSSVGDYFGTLNPTFASTPLAKLMNWTGPANG